MNEMEAPVSFNLAPAEPNTDLQTQSLPQLAQEVLELYRELLLHPKSDLRTPDDTQNLLDQFGRFKIWIEQTGAALETAGSLQDTLQQDAALQTSVAGVLQQLKNLLSTALSVPLGSGTGVQVSELDDASLTSDSEYSSTSDASSQPQPRPRISRFSLVLTHIFEQIGLLYHYSAIFRRPRLRGRYLHSRAQHQNAEVPHYEYSHVQQKLGAWSSASDSPDLNVLCWRLATANARRREQLRYWARHPFDEEHDGADDVAPSASPKAQIFNHAPSETASGRSHPATANTFSSVARSAIYDTQTVAGPSRTVYASSDFGVDGASSVRVPKAPAEADHSLSFECPFCRMTLQSALMRDSNTWKRHVFRDLRPYVCTFAQCSNPDKLYATRREWIYHEMQMHRRQWNCRPCHRSYAKKEMMESHIRLLHGQLGDKPQLAAVLEASERPIEPEYQQACPLCGSELALSALMAHVAGHMEELALFVLPAGDEDVPASPSEALSSLDSVADDIRQTLDVTPHTIPITNENGLVFECDVCGRAYKQPHHLSRHKLYHGRPHACPHQGCNLRFATRRDCERHLSKIHMKTREFFCREKDCAYSREGGKSFSRKADWSRHMQNSHGLSVQELEIMYVDDSLSLP
ncbi:hypothetical protein QBC42DRAFT_20434 [Cladorrhinum samala]|uniref:C2H2-type domain-containing protein n=1 Tax=Cladorrhinum samala TaxID=585594 RepID=A0AAV9HFD9_9PEZI|nr:hypothetical protein QBC42DRAFT_20434 [Cladorrhinum samala]